MKLLRKIIRCPNVEICLASSRQNHPCAKIVTSQHSKSFTEHQVPEPWSGHLHHAPILFVSSNPSISKTEQYPRGSWSERETEKFFARRFDDGWIRDGTQGRKTNGSYGRKTPFWSAVRSHAIKLLEIDAEDIRPGKHYALTEVVHCKSRKEKIGVKEAVKECAPRYLRKTLKESGARVIVVLGAIARNAVKREFGIPKNENVYGPIKIGRHERYIVFLPHPNARGYRSFERCMPEQLQKLQAALRQ